MEYGWGSRKIVPYRVRRENASENAHATVVEYVVVLVSADPIHANSSDADESVDSDK